MRRKEIKSKNIYQRYNGEIIKYEVLNNNTVVDTRTGQTISMYNFMLLGRWAENPLDLLDKGDYVVLEYKSPKYVKRIRRNFEVNIVGNHIIFENSHANIYAKMGEEKITDSTLKKIELISVLTNEQFNGGMAEI